MDHGIQPLDYQLTLDFAPQFAQDIPGLILAHTHSSLCLFLQTPVIQNGYS
jgi:hypothetical protein